MNDGIFLCITHAVAVLVGCAIGASIGFHDGVRQTEREAASVGAASWQTDADGRPVFRWNVEGEIKYLK